MTAQGDEASHSETPTLVWDPSTGTWRTPDEVASPRPAAAPEAPPRPREPARGTASAALVGALVGAVVASAVTFAGMRLGRSPAPVAVERVQAGGGTVRPVTNIVEIAARARPWVVNIEVRGFGFRGVGSGVILRSDGHIVTNAHVVQNAQQVTVTLASGEEIEGRVVGADPDTDIAVVKIDRENLPAAILGSVKNLRVGETVVAIGSPLGLQQTVTAGIVSALGRQVEGERGRPLVDMIQTDAAVTQGNSGGALVDATGAVVGITTAIAASPQVGAEGIAFAIPIDIARTVADELIATGRATHPWLGVLVSDIDPESARRFGVSGGVLVVEVVPGGPANRAGIRNQDVIVAFDDERIGSVSELTVALRRRKVGERMRVTVIREGQRQTFDVTVGDRPAE